MTRNTLHNLDVFGGVLPNFFPKNGSFHFSSFLRRDKGLQTALSESVASGISVRRPVCDIIGEVICRAVSSDFFGDKFCMKWIFVYLKAFSVLVRFSFTLYLYFKEVN